MAKPKAKKLAQARRIKAELPPAVDVDKFVHARQHEIASLENSIRSANDARSVRVFQTLPRALRRRAASHDARRVPIRYRSKALSEIVPGKGPVKRKIRKLPARKRDIVRRRSRSETLIRRQKSKVWLPTHLWHAKRMHMIDRWGFKIADKPTAKAYRSSYRASVNGCLVNDISYFRHIILKGSEKDLTILFSLLCDPSSSAPCSKIYINGSRISHVSLYKPKSYPFNLIGPVSIIWRPQIWDFEFRQVMIMFHPTISVQVAEAIKSAISLAKIPIGMEHAALASFELTGPYSGNVISSILKGSSGSNEFNVLSRSSPSQVAPNMILGMTVDDPRLTFPPKIANPSKESFASCFTSPSPDIANNDLFWDSAVSGLKPRFTKKELDKRREQNNIPSTKLTKTQKDDRVPILVFQKCLGDKGSNSAQNKPLSGWTILLPLGFSLPFFHSLVALPVATGGLRTRHQQHFEAGEPFFPNDWALTQASSAESSRSGQELKYLWSRKPPSKRDNYEKLCTKYPFEAVWSQVLRQEEKSEDKGVDVDEEEALSSSGQMMDIDEPVKLLKTCKPWMLQGQLLSKLINKVYSKELANSDAAKQYIMDKIKEYQYKLKNLTDEQAKEETGNHDLLSFDACLVRIKVVPLSNGSMNSLAMVYSPNAEQYEKILMQANKKGTSSFNDNQEEQDCKGFSLDQVKDCQLVGRLTSANYSLKHGESFGIGAIRLDHVLTMLYKYKRKRDSELFLGFVLVRNNNGRIARPALVSLIP